MRSFFVCSCIVWLYGNSHKSLALSLKKRRINFYNITSCCRLYRNSHKSLKLSRKKKKLSLKIILPTAGYTVTLINLLH